jgi:hypothetical protein
MAPTYYYIAVADEQQRTSIFPSSEGPYYRKGMWISCGACLLVAVLATIQSVSLHAENKYHDQKYGSIDPTTDTQFEVNNKSGTDRRFRYMI